MKRLFFLSCVAFLPFIALAQQKGGYEITGRIAGLQEGEKIVIHLVSSNGYDASKLIPSDSAYVKNGQFHISGVVPDGPRIYWLDFVNKEKTCILAIANNDKITITSDINIDDIHHTILQNYLKIDGSKANRTNIYITPVENSYMTSMYGLNNYLKKIEDSVGFDPSLVGAIIEAKNRVSFSVYLNFYKTPDTGIVHYPALLEKLIPHFNDMSGHSYLVKEIYDQLDKEGKSSYNGKVLKDWIPLCVGQPFPTFTLPDVQGKPLSFNDVVAKGKITLVHFWANRSFKRRELEEELRTQYNKYHSKGLNVVGISSDTLAYEWKGIVETEKFPWYNVSDLKGSKGVVRTTYHELGYDPENPNTTNVLVDGTGKIIAWNVKGIELQWYLWKYLDSNAEKNALISNK